MSLLDILEQAPQKKIMVVGDFCIDRLIIGSMTDVSRDAPAPIVEISKESIYPGAAGNTAANLLSIGAQVYPVGVVGDDDSGRFLIDYFNKNNGNSSGLLIQEGRKTNTYTKIFCEVPHSLPTHQLRLDTKERKMPVPEDNLLSYIKRIARTMNAILVSDYEKGVVSNKVLAEIAFSSTQLNIPSIGDSRNRIDSFFNFTALKPNDYEIICSINRLKPRDPEIEELRKDSATLDTAAFNLINRLGTQSIFITRGEEGITVYHRENGDVKKFEVPTKKVQVYDITGAGDSTGAAIALALASGANLKEAAELGNLAGGIAVSHWGTYAVTSSDLEKAIREFENV